MQQQRGPKIDFREILGLSDFRLLQQYRHLADMTLRAADVGSSG
jgi:hypothetical protein